MELRLLQAKLKAYLSKEGLEVPPQIASFFPTHFTPHQRATVVSLVAWDYKTCQSPHKEMVGRFKYEKCQTHVSKVGVVGSEKILWIFLVCPYQEVFEQSMTWWASLTR